MVNSNSGCLCIMVTVNFLTLAIGNLNLFKTWEVVICIVQELYLNRAKRRKKKKKKEGIREWDRTKANIWFSLFSIESRRSDRFQRNLHFEWHCVGRDCRGWTPPNHTWTVTTVVTWHSDSAGQPLISTPCGHKPEFYSLLCENHASHCVCLSLHFCLCK